MRAVGMPGKEGPPHVTVVVPVKDRREQMLRCLDAVLALDYPRYDVLVADNGSSDGTPDAVRERSAGTNVDVAVVTIEGPVGAVRNRAAALAQGEIVAFTDSDCLPQPGWLTAGVKPFADDERVGVVCGRTLPEQPIDGARWPATIQVEELSWRFEAANLLVRREGFVASDGFDEHVGHFWEDTTAGFAMLRHGWRVAFVADAVVLHDVTFPGYRWHLRRAWKQSHIGPAVAAYPEIRERLFWLGVFQRPRSAAFLAFALALLLAPRSRWALLLAIPYLAIRAPRTLYRYAPRDFAELVAFDAVNVAGGFVGGLRERQLVL
jgi:cellulose synthase/poly-beta-1,6-N-acetylglucosamine synthase-like glycosyltransferase